MQILPRLEITNATTTTTYISLSCVIEGVYTRGTIFLSQHKINEASVSVMTLKQFIPSWHLRLEDRLDNMYAVVSLGRGFKVKRLKVQTVMTFRASKIGSTISMLPSH